MPSIRLGLTAVFTLTLLATSPASADPLGSAVTYQGHLKDGGSPANGPYTMEFKLFDADTLGNQVGPTLTFDGGGNPQVNVTNGLFTVVLDFTAASYNGDKRWLDITVAGTPLTPRQELTPAPHARFSAAPWATSGANIHYTGGIVGIGTTTPSFPLSLGTNLGNKLALYDGPDKYGFGVVGALLQVFSGSATTDIAFGYGDSNAFTETMRIRGTGNVGIGTSNPTDRLAVVGSGAAISVTDGGVQSRFISSTPLGVSWIGTNSAHPFWLLTSDIPRVAIDPAGNVGIGTLSPAQKLSVAGTIESISGGVKFPDGTTQTTAGGFWSSSGNNIYNNNTGNVGIRTTNPTKPLTIRAAQADDRWLSLNDHNDNPKWEVGLDGDRLGFYEVGVTASRLLLRTGGNVGIGTAAPAQPLHVAGNARVDGTLFASTVSSNSPLALQTAGTTRVFVDDTTGNVGIGTASPATKLHVSSATDTEFSVQSTDTNGRRWTLQSSGNSVPSLAGTFQIVDRTASASRFQIDTQGNVGIGTTSPTTKLHLTSAINTEMSLESTVSGGRRWAVQSSGTGTQTGTFQIVDWTASALRILIDTDGNVGIGTANPGQKLHVVGNICATGTIGACSDARFKKNVTGLTDALDRVAQLRGVSFEWQREEFANHQFADGRQVGFIAQEVEKVLPEVVARGSDGYRSVDYGRLTPVIVEAVKQIKQEKDAEIAALRADVKELKSIVALLRAANRTED